MKASALRTYKILKYILYKETHFNVTEIFWSFVGAFCGILFVSFLNYYFFSQTDLVLMIGSFGASAVLIYGIPHSPLSRYRNVFGGHVLSAIIGVTIQHFYGHLPWLAPALAVSLAIVVMQITRTIHPPGGATALIAVIGSEKIKSLGYLYVVFPVGIGVVLMLAVGTMITKVSRNRKSIFKPVRKTNETIMR